MTITFVTCFTHSPSLDSPVASDGLIVEKDLRHYKRIERLAVKFGKASSAILTLRAFTNDVQRHLDLHGMD
jgi:hypothetical protein